ncbi:MAG: DNA-binding protein [Xenococcaceae cyanobacterium]
MTRGRPAKVKKEDVIAACDQLVQEGQNVTVKNVLGMVGGSAREVSPIVRKYKASAGIPEALEDIENDDNNGALSVTEPEEIADVQKETSHSTSINPRQTMSAQAKEQAQLEAAQHTLAKNYFIATQDYETPGLKEQVNQGLEEIYKRANAEMMDNLFPKDLQEKLRTPKT